MKDRLIECPGCALSVPADAAECPYCAYEFPVARAGVRPMTWLMIGLTVLFGLPILAWLFGWLG